MNETTHETSARVEAARDALGAHDELLRIDESETQFELGPDDLPLDAAGWLEWHEHEYKPADADWQHAMDRLREVLGEEFPGTHPFTFRPVCEQITSQAANTTRGDGAR